MLTERRAENGPLPQPVKTDTRPLYARTIEAMTRLLAQGEYRSGDMLPKEFDLAKRLGVSRSTLRVALGYLETHGLISRRPGVGTFVAAAKPAQTRPGFMGALNRMETLTTLAKLAGQRAAIAAREVERVAAAPEEVADELGLPPGAGAIRIQMVQSLNDRRGAYFDTYLPAEMVEYESVRDFAGDTIEYLAQFPDLVPTHTRSEVFAEPASGHVAEMMGLTPGHCLLHLRETFFNARDRAVAFSYTYFLTGVFHFYLIRRVMVRP
jgi:GntR family transcriptional regulator